MYSSIFIVVYLVNGTKIYSVIVFDFSTLGAYSIRLGIDGVENSRSVKVW